MDIAELKPASDAVQAAKQAWYDAVAVMADHDHNDIQGLGLVAERAEAAQKFTSTWPAPWPMTCES